MLQCFIFSKTVFWNIFPSDEYLMSSAHCTISKACRYSHKMPLLFSCFTRKRMCPQITLVLPHNISFHSCKFRFSGWYMWTDMSKLIGTFLQLFHSRCSYISNIVKLPWSLKRNVSGVVAILASDIYWKICLVFYIAPI